MSATHWKCGDHWHVRLKVQTKRKSKAPPPPYLVEAEVEGLFNVDPDFPNEKVEDLVRMNGGAILYGTVRELMLSFSSRSKHGPGELPTIDARMFLDPKKPAKKASKKKATKSTEKKAVPQ